jgi:NADH-quinone oxidoreductase subunit M
MGQRTQLFDQELLFGWSLQHWAFLLLLIGFIIKVPSVPLHTWLPDAHVEAPTPISMILAGVLLKMGGYGIIRICYPICPHAGYDLAWLVCLIGVVSMVYGALAALAQKDFKRMVAYSSVSHMGYVVLGLGVWTATAGYLYTPDYWTMGVKGAMFQMIGHGISSAGMFFLVGVVYDRVHHRNLDQFGGMFGKMPVYTALSIGIFFAALGLPGLCGFVGEVFVVLSAWRFDYVLAIIAASVVILTAAYILWAIQRVYLGAEYHGPHEEALTPMTTREKSIAIPLFVLAIWFGVYPQVVLNYMDNTIERQVQQLADWTRNVKEPALARQADQPESVPPSAGEQSAASAQPLTPRQVAAADRWEPPEHDTRSRPGRAANSSIPSSPPAQSKRGNQGLARGGELLSADRPGASEASRVNVARPLR